MRKKKILSLIVTLILMCTIFVSPFETFAVGTNEDNLQGFIDETKELLTTEATKQVQRAAKITVDGLAGSQTIRACYTLLAK